MSPTAHRATQNGQHSGQHSGQQTADPNALAWARLMLLFIERRDEMFRLLEGHGLTPPHGFALAALSAGPVRMRDLAERLSCDASYVTSIVDRLEETGLAHRHPSSQDRRVKEVGLTAKGHKAAAVVRATMTEPPARFKRLSKAQRGEFAALIERLVPESETLPDPFRNPIRR